MRNERPSRNAYEHLRKEKRTTMILPMFCSPLPPSLVGFPVYCVGIKGTGMAALAELLTARGAIVTGSDVPEEFYTDRLLRKAGIRVLPGFDGSRIHGGMPIVIYSSAYSPDSNPELGRAVELGIPSYTYPQNLGAVTRLSPSAAVAGVHGKTTTTALAGVVSQALGLRATVLAGSAVSSFGDSSILSLGTDWFVAETCEYRRHFLSFSPSRILLTSVEPDHLDYFTGYDDILSAFLEFIRLLPNGGTLVYCADDPGAREAAGRIRGEGLPVSFVPYGETAEGPYRITRVEEGEGRTRFRIARFEIVPAGDGWFEIRIPGRFSVLNATGALALILGIAEQECGMPLGTRELLRITQGIAAFRGSRRRAEILGEAGGILFMDDYGHHPTAVRKTIAGIRRFYPSRRIVVDFMSHTYSRTQALLSDFASAFPDADEVILHKIYASAREREGTVTGEVLYRATARWHPKVRDDREVMDSFPYLAGSLRPGDLFLTMGAGNNWTLGRALYEHFSASMGGTPR